MRDAVRIALDCYGLAKTGNRDRAVDSRQGIVRRGLNPVAPEDACDGTENDDAEHTEAQDAEPAAGTAGRLPGSGRMRMPRQLFSGMKPAQMSRIDVAEVRLVETRELRIEGGHVLAEV